MSITNIILLLMIIIYSIPIIHIYYNFKNQQSISSIMSGSNSQLLIHFPIFILCCLSITYEYLKRDCYISLLIIGFLIFALLGIVNTDESMISHYIFAYIVTTSILIYMYFHRSFSNLSYLLFYSQIYIGIQLVENLSYSKCILIEETLFLLNFAIFYLIVSSYE